MSDVVKYLFSINKTRSKREFILTAFILCFNVTFNIVLLLLNIVVQRNKLHIIFHLHRLIKTLPLA